MLHVGIAHQCCESANNGLGFRKVSYLLIRYWCNWIVWYVLLSLSPGMVIVCFFVNEASGSFCSYMIHIYLKCCDCSWSHSLIRLKE